jgi:hypothetical protein
MGEGECSGARGALQLEDRGAGGGERGRGGFGLEVPTRERERFGATVLVEGMNLTGGPHPSAARERERGSRLGRGVLGQNGRKEEGEEKSLFIFQTNFPFIFQMDF